jgi:hypothetical protein
MMLGQALILLVLVGQPSSEEDTDAERKAEAGKHIARGNEALRAGDAAGALEAYQEAYDAYPSAKIFFNMAEAHRELDNLLEAASLYERVMNEVPSDSPLVSAAQEKLQELDGRLGRISVSTEPSGAKIEIGGREVGTSPVDDVRVPAGRVEVRATLDGNTKTETVDVEAGSARAVEIDLVQMFVEPPPPPPPPGGDEDESIAEKWWFWTLIGVGVVGAGTAAALIATSGDDFVPMGELGYTRLDEWRKLP